MLTAVPAPPTSPAAPIRERPTFESVYGAGFTHVWHTLRRLGVPEADLLRQPDGPAAAPQPLAPKG